jgi:hypothetical protein
LALARAAATLTSHLYHSGALSIFSNVLPMLTRSRLHECTFRYSALVLPATTRSLAHHSIRRRARSKLAYFST